MPIYYFEIIGKKITLNKVDTVAAWKKSPTSNERIIATRDSLDLVTFEEIGINEKDHFNPTYPITIKYHGLTRQIYNEEVRLEKYRNQEDHFISEELEYRHALYLLNQAWINNRERILPLEQDRAEENFELLKKGIAEDRKLRRIAVKNTNLDKNSLDHETKNYHKPQITLMTNYTTFLNNADNKNNEPHTNLLIALNTASQWYKSTKTKQAITALQFLVICSIIATAIAVALVYVNPDKLAVNIDIVLGCLAFLFGIAGMDKAYQSIQSRNIQKQYDSTSHTLFSNPQNKVASYDIQLMSIKPVPTGNFSKNPWPFEFGFGLENSTEQMLKDRDLTDVFTRKLIAPTLEEIGFADSTMPTLIKRGTEYFLYGPATNWCACEVTNEVFLPIIQAQRITFPKVGAEPILTNNAAFCSFITTFQPISEVPTSSASTSS